MSDFALQTDGSQNYITLGTMGSFGSNLGSGFYCKFYINTSSTNGKYMGYQEGNGQTIEIIFNTDHAEGYGNTKLCIKIADNAGHYLQGGIDTPTISFNDGSNHLIEITVVCSTNTITLKIDGVSQTVTYQLQQTPATFNNLGQAFYIGAYNNSGTPGNYFPATFDDFLIGTTSATLYGNYQMDAGLGTTLADTSGQGNTGTLTGTPPPSWVSGLAPVVSTQHNLGLLGIGA